MNSITAQTPAELWLREVLDQEIEPLYRQLQAGNPGSPSRYFRYEVQAPARCGWTALALLTLLIVSFVFFVR